MSFEETYRKFSSLVFNLALQYVQNMQDAEEITQDVFVSVHQSLDAFRQEAGISTWIYRITINKSLDFIKAQKRKKRFAFITSLFQHQSDEMNISGHQFDHPGILLEQKEAVEHIFLLINALPDNQKTALILSRLEHKSQKEVADIMKLSPKAVESLLQRAKTNLAKKYDEAKEKKNKIV